MKKFLIILGICIVSVMIIVPLLQFSKSNKQETEKEKLKIDIEKIDLGLIRKDVISDNIVYLIKKDKFPQSMGIVGYSLWQDGDSFLYEENISLTETIYIPIKILKVRTKDLVVYGIEYFMDISLIRDENNREIILNKIKLMKDNSKFKINTYYENKIIYIQVIDNQYQSEYEQIKKDKENEEKLKTIQENLNVKNKIESIWN